MHIAAPIILTPKTCPVSVCQGRHRGGGVVGPSELDGPAKATEKMLRFAMIVIVTIA